MKGVELPTLAADADRLAAQAEREELLPGDDTVLAGRHLGEGSVVRSSAWFDPHTGLNHAFGGHAARIPPSA